MDTSVTADHLHDAVVAVASRSGLEEQVHRGSAVVVDASGRVLVAVGSPDAPTYGRSCHKPLQLLAMLRCGLTLRTDALLAVAMSSHSGSLMHLALVRSLLEGAGLDESALGNVADFPVGPTERDEWIRAGHGAERIAMNCSGKHAAMLATCVHNGWPTGTYLDPAHPLQQRVVTVVGELTGDTALVGIDGCGAPTPATSLTGLARAFSKLALAGPGTHESVIAGVIRREPVVLGGVGRPVTEMLRSAPGWIAKDGACGVFAAALANGTAVAVKIADGLAEPRLPVALAALDAAGVDVPASLDDLRRITVLGGGQVVGELRAVALG